MSEFNPHILLAMRWFQNNGSISYEQLRNSYHAARKVYTAAEEAYAASVAYNTAVLNDAFYAALDTALDAALDAASAKVVYDTVAADAVAADAVNAAAHGTAGNAATNATRLDYWLTRTKESLDKYFELTKENRGAYEQRAKHLNVLGVNND